MVVVVVVTLNFNDPLEDNLLGAIDTGENGDVVRIKCVLHFLGKIVQVKRAELRQLRVEARVETEIVLVRVGALGGLRKVKPFELSWPLG